MKNNCSKYVKKWYEGFWKKTEFTKDYIYKAPIIEKLIPREGKLNVLDFGCGNGIVVQQLLKINPSLNITGVDISSMAISSAKKRAPKQKFRVVESEEKLPFKDNSFDYILVFDVLMYVNDTEFVFKELSRVLKPKGKLIITVPFFGLLKNIVIAMIGFETVYNPRNPEIRFYSLKSLKKEIISAGLKVGAFGCFGRFYLFSNAMYCIAKK